MVARITATGTEKMTSYKTTEDKFSNVILMKHSRVKKIKIVQYDQTPAVNFN